jgi:plastocyanin
VFRIPDGCSSEQLHHNKIICYIFLKGTFLGHPLRFEHFSSYCVYLVWLQIKNDAMKKLIGTKSRLLSVSGFLFALLFILNGCEKSMPDMTGENPGGSKGPGVNEVFIENMAFNPSTITVAANTTITWTNKDGVIHTVTSDAGLFDSKNLGKGGTFSFTFVESGTYAYHCTPHPSMTASVKVN